MAITVSLAMTVSTVARPHRVSGSKLGGVAPLEVAASKTGLAAESTRYR